MDESYPPYNPSLFQLLSQEGPFGLLTTLVLVIFPLCLLISRIRGCFRVQPTRLGRDLAFLFAGPITALLYAAIKAMIAAKSYVQGGIDASFPLIYGLDAPIEFCDAALLGFLLGVIAFALPAKAQATESV